MPRCSFRPLGQSTSEAEEEKEQAKKENKKKKKGGGHRCDQNVKTPGLVSGAALAEAGDGEPKNSCCPLLLSQRVAAR